MLFSFEYPCELIACNRLSASWENTRSFYVIAVDSVSFDFTCRDAVLQLVFFLVFFSFPES